MPTAQSARLEYEAGQTAYAMQALTNSGDHKLFRSEATLWSGKSGFTPVVRPNGLATGGTIVPAVSGSNSVVDVAALTAYLVGQLYTVAADTDVAITRPATDVAKICSVTVNGSGAIAVVAGTDGSTAEFSATRGAAGGPPFIPTTSIEIGQVRLTSATAAPISAAEVFQVIGVHQERYDYPVWDELNSTGEVSFVGALPLIHTGSTSKPVYASYFEPIFAEVSLAADFKAPEVTHSVSSTQIYNRTIGSSSQSLGQGGFTAWLTDGITDPLVREKNQLLWFRFYPDRYKGGYLLTQGMLGIGREFPASDNLKASCTISASNPAVEVAG